LPGVRELFQHELPTAPKKSTADLYKNINYEYYGLRDDENEDMLEEEAAYEQRRFNETLEKWIDENQDYIKTKLKGVSKPTKQQIIDLVDDQSYEEFKKQHDARKSKTHPYLLFRGSTIQKIYYRKQRR
jgi:hypothetical protein